MIDTIPPASWDAIYPEPSLKTESALVHTYHFHASFQTSTSDFRINNLQQPVVSIAGTASYAARALNNSDEGEVQA